MSDLANPPLLNRSDPTRTARAVALVLHGGAVRSLRPVDHRSASWHRARMLQRAIAPGLHEQGVAVWLLRYGVKGWNDLGAPSPVPDAQWALDRIREELDVPVVLVGHSMGARTAMRVAADPAVQGVVALAPWLPAGEPVAALRGRDLAVAHGRRDRITSFALSRAYVERASAVTRSATFHDMGPLGHYLLRERERWHGFAATSALAMLER